MGEESKNNRGKKMADDIKDETAKMLTEMGIDAVHAVLQEVKEWVIKSYSKLKSGSKKDTEAELKRLEMRIAISNENVEIGMKRKEIAVMWAMRKIGYSEEQAQKVLDLANKAYEQKG